MNPIVMRVEPTTEKRLPYVEFIELSQPFSGGWNNSELHIQVENSSMGFDLTKEMKVEELTEAIILRDFEHHALSSALLLLGFTYSRALSFRMDDKIEWENAIVISPPKGITIRSRSSQQPDFFDLLRELDEALKELSLCLRGINDPTVLDARMKLVRASTDSMRCYIDIDNPDGPEEIPGEVVKPLRDRLKQIEWSKISEHANKWAQTILKILDAWTKGS